MKKRVLVTVDRGETRVAILEREESSPQKQRGTARRRKSRTAHEADWRVAELYLERRSHRSIAGNIYKGRVDNVLPGLEAAFVDIDVEKNGFLHVDDVVAPGVTTGRRDRGRRRIADMLKPGQEIVVQAVKDPLKTKGARLDMQLTIPGRYLVYVPQGEGVGVSRRLSDKERERLRKIAAKLKVAEGGVIVRTAAQGSKQRELERELEYLFKLRDVLDQRVSAAKAPAMVFQEADLPVRAIRDVFSDEFEGAIIDDEQQHHRVVSFFKRTAPELVKRVELYKGDEPLFERYGVEEVVRSTLERRVGLPSGGYLVIDPAEALTIIDVNTGSFVGRGRASLEDTITKTNVEAAEEVVRQLRLRDIGGIIVIDFIDMERARNRQLVLKTLQEHLERDRTKTYVMNISPLGLVEMTRQNVTEGVRGIMAKRCPTCDGEGVVLSEETVAIQVERKLRELGAESKSEAFLINVHPRVAAILIGGGGKPLSELERETGKRFHFEGIEVAPLDTFSVTAEGTLEEIEKKALPFAKGEEVLIDVVEPHMYNADDAIAKINGYVISIAGAARFVGEKKLVRIDEVKRTAAYASLVEDEPSHGAAGKERPSSKVGASREEKVAEDVTPSHEGAADGEVPKAERAARSGASRRHETAKRGASRKGQASERGTARQGKAAGERPRGRTAEVAAKDSTSAREPSKGADGPRKEAAGGQAGGEQVKSSAAAGKRRRGHRGGRRRSRRKPKE